MPGPGRKGRKPNKSNQSNTPGASSSGSGPNSNARSFYLKHIDDKEEWNVLISRLCEFFSLPDLHSRSGLKKIHANFSAIYDKMDNLFQESQDHVRVRGAIVGIFAKMSIDSLLRDKLLQKDLLGKIMPLTQEDETRHLALRALDTVTHHGGAHARMEVAKHSNVIAKLIDDFPDDYVVAELGVAILTHSVVAVVAGDEVPANPRILKSIDMVQVLKSVLDALKRFHTKGLPIMDHGIHLLVVSSLHASQAYKLYPPALSFLAAGLRSQDWACRSACLGGFLRAYQLESEEDFNQFDAMRFVSVYQSQGVPPHLDRILMSYGPKECTLYQSLTCTVESQKAMVAYANSRERDLYALGLKQAALIMKTEYSIADGTFQVQDPRSGNFVTEDLDMPFTQWKDSLPLTAKAIRKKGYPDEAYLADILEIKYLIGKRALPKVMEVANKGLKHNPEQGYFYYALSLTGDDVQGLRASKKGLKCKENTPYIRHQLLQRAVDHAGDLGVKILQAMPESGNKQWEEGVAFVMSAIEDAKRYLREAPPDSRHTRNVGQWLVLLTLLANPDINPNLKELDEILKKIDVADEFTMLMGGRAPPKTNLRLAQKGIIKHYPLGAAQFSNIFAHFDKLNSANAPPKNPAKMDGDIAAWLEDMSVEEGYINEVVNDCHANTLKRNLNVNEDVLALYRCSWCGNPSAVLRKCSGCSTSRYCDSACQKSDWKGHKIICRGQDAHWLD